MGSSMTSPSVTAALKMWPSNVHRLLSWGSLGSHDFVVFWQLLTVSSGGLLTASAKDSVYGLCGAGGPPIYRMRYQRTHRQLYHNVLAGYACCGHDRAEWYRCILSLLYLVLRNH